MINTTNSSHVNIKNEKYQQENIENYIGLLDSLSVLDPEKMAYFRKW